MSYFFTSESVSQGHPDKVADQISDAIVDNFIARDSESHCAVETLVTTGQVVVAGEVKSEAYVDIPEVVRETINKIGYTKSEYRFDGNSCGILNAIHEQSQDIDRGVSRTSKDEQGAGDQGIMFGYATNETDNYMPATLDIAHKIVKELADIREKENYLMSYLRPDSKSQVTIEYSDDNVPIRITDIVVSTQHDEFSDSDEKMLERIKYDVINKVIPRVKSKYSEKIQNLFNDDIRYFVNPTGKFVIGGPHGDTGLTGRKIIVDTYGGWGAHGGGAFCGKDVSKVDRSAAYMARYLAKNAVASGLADRMLIQFAYAIGVAEPISLFVNTYGTANVNMSDNEIAEKIKTMFDLRPYAIEQKLKLRNPIYLETASYGHMGQEPRTVTKRFHSRYDSIEKTVELFTWEKLDDVVSFKKEFNLWFVEL